MMRMVSNQMNQMMRQLLIANQKPEIKVANKMILTLVLVLRFCKTQVVVKNLQVAVRLQKHWLTKKT